MTDHHQQPPAVREPQRVDHPAPARHRSSLAALWFGLLGAPVAWSIHTLAATALNSYACIAPRGQQPPAGVRPGSVVWLVLVALTLLLVVLAAAALGTAYRSWRRVRNRSQGESGELLEVGEGRTRFMALSGILLGSVFLLALAANSLPLFMVPQCLP